jgi:hypothetical protein
MGMHYVTRRSHRMQKHKFGETCPDDVLWKLHRAHQSMKNSALTFRAPNALECNM